MLLRGWNKAIIKKKVMLDEMGKVDGLPSPKKRLLTWKTTRKYRAEK